VFIMFDLPNTSTSAFTPSRWRLNGFRHSPAMLISGFETPASEQPRDEGSRPSPRQLDQHDVTTRGVARS